MSRIRILSDALASQVAAGEVVERPAPVVRELVENSLDAGATHVEVHVQRGGAAFIRVADNGFGMEREDALLCLERRLDEQSGSLHQLDDVTALAICSSRPAVAAGAKLGRRAA